MSFAQRIVVVLMAWAVLYLPWLGTSGLRSEEGHRVLPAVEMLESGNFLVPHVGGQPYLRKPPLINWLIAASFKLTGARNEWTARLPSVLAVLVMALAFVILGRETLGAVGSVSAALAWLTSLGMIEKGRMIEIEAVYVSLFGLAFLCWLKRWREAKTPWLTWTVPWMFLGFGILTKGPALLFFFYALVVAILWCTQRLRQVFHPAHLLGLLVMFGIFAAWALPYSRAVESEQIAQTWGTEVASRFTGADATFHDWLLNFPSGVAYFLPFVLFLPLIRFSKLRSEDASIAKGIFLGSIIPFCLVLILPGAIPRYILPTLVPVCCLFGLALNARAFEWKLSLGQISLDVSPKIVWSLVLTVVLGAAIIFPLRSATVQKRRPGYNRIAGPINKTIPAGNVLYAVNPGYQPVLFYLHAPIKYLSRLEQLPGDARYVLVRESAQRQFENSAHLAASRPRLLSRIKGVRGLETILYGLTPP